MKRQEPNPGVLLICCDCGESKAFYPSEVKLMRNRYAITGDVYRCRPCWNKKRAARKVNPREKSAPWLMCCGGCGGTLKVSKQRFDRGGAFYCRCCFSKHVHTIARCGSPAKKLAIPCRGCGKRRRLSQADVNKGSGYCRSCARKGSRNSSWGGGKVVVTCKECGKTKKVSGARADKLKHREWPYFCRECSLDNRPSGVYNPAWQGGKSFEPYPTEWTTRLKKLIRKRDGYCCFICGASQQTQTRKLSIHHVDYNKVNVDSSNLVSLCLSCHAKTNYNRVYWTSHLTAMMLQRMVGQP